MKRAPIPLVSFACLVNLLRVCAAGGSKYASPAPLHLSIDRSALPAATVNVPYHETVTLTASGGTSPYLYSCAVSNGAGLSASFNSADPTDGIVSCSICGTPLAAGAFTLTFSVTDSAYASDSVGPLSFNIGTSSDPLACWHGRNPLLQGDGLTAVVCGNGTFVAMSEEGAILTSPDGITWTSGNPGINAQLSGVTYGNGTFVAVGGGTILSSSDGATWTPRNAGVHASLNGVAYGNDTFVAAGDAGVLLTSPDGVTWKSRDLGTALDLLDVAYGNGTFAAMGYAGILFTSPDGVTWIPKNVGRAHLYGVTWAMASSLP